LVKSQLVVGDAVTLAPLAGSPAAHQPFLGLYAKGKADLPALVLAHGVGNHPDEGLTGSLRQRLHDMGYTTLAIQLPIAAKEATVDNYYPALFPEASSRLQAASSWLKAKGHTKVVLISHTMGSWMANVYLDQSAQNNAYQAWVCISLTGGYSFAVRNYPFPVLDLYGEQDIPVTVSAAWRRAGLLRLAATGSKQVMIPGADAQWRGKEQAAADAIAEFLRALP
jgi:pimeloyl-ACP methyl ester carboxylesterase